LNNLKHPGWAEGRQKRSHVVTMLGKNRVV
jgi:hypothetical protein